MGRCKLNVAPGLGQPLDAVKPGSDLWMSYRTADDIAACASFLASVLIHAAPDVVEEVRQPGAKPF